MRVDCYSAVANASHSLTIMMLSLRPLNAITIVGDSVIHLSVAKVSTYKSVTGSGRFYLSHPAYLTPLTHRTPRV